MGRYSFRVQSRIPFSTLPALPKRLARKKTERRAEALFTLLRQVALANQSAQPQTFYSLRQVAGNFRLSLSLVSGVFHLLAEEGLIGQIRGSRTVLHGRKYDRHLHVRGVVALPASIFRFSAFADYRVFNTQLRRQLRRRGFMPAAIFFDRQEIRDGSLAEHILEAKADTAIWFSPGRECQKTVARLHDAGVRVLGVNDYIFPAIVCRYEICRENALRTILRQWRADGLKSTIVAGEPRGRSAADEERCYSWSVEEKLPSNFLMIEGDGVKRALGALRQRENRGILLTASAAALCAVREPEAFWELMQKRRVALVDGPISLLFATIPAVPVDLIAVDWPAVTDRIVRDLIDQTAWVKSESLVFHAEAQLGVPLNRFCSEI